MHFTVNCRLSGGSTVERESLQSSTVDFGVYSKKVYSKMWALNALTVNFLGGFTVRKL